MIKNKSIIALLIIALLSLSFSCKGPENNEVLTQDYPVMSSVSHPEWAKDAIIYEVNIRQYSEEGTFNAFAEHLPRLRELGIDILWLMPVFPIGEVYKKTSQTVLVEEVDDQEVKERTLGSYYSIKDYNAVNPEFGTMEDFEALVKQAHDMGMYVILDIAVNHTAWDHPWITEHPEFYTSIDSANPPWNAEWMEAHPEYYAYLKSLGMTYPIHPSETDWWDTADLNYENKELREEFLKTFKFWVEELNIDGYRADVAGWVPCDFWEDVRASLDSIKPVFMLAEDEGDNCLLENAFNMNYGWEFHHIMNDVAKGEKTVDAMREYFEKQDSIYDPNIIKMNFITNHDENSWNGTVSERLGEAAEVFAAIYYTVPGMPLLYSGQEIGLDKRLKFFERDPIVWHESEWEAIYTQLGKIKKANKALWNGEEGGEITFLNFENLNDKLFAFERVKDDNHVIVLANVSDETIHPSVKELAEEGSWKDALTGQEIDLSEGFTLPGYDYSIWVRATK